MILISKQFLRKERKGTNEWMQLCSFPPLLIAALIFCLFLQLSCMLRPLYPCLRPLQILPFVTALCNLTLLNFIIKHMAGSEAHHYTFLKMETVLGIH